MNKRIRRASLFLLALALFSSASSSVFAESRQVSVRVSCTVLPMLELPSMARLQNRRLSADQYHQPDYRVQESFLQKADGLVKVYSITTL